MGLLFLLMTVTGAQSARVIADDGDLRAKRADYRLAEIWLKEVGE